jgi:PHP family Zn ribbon phosphoesterase
MKQKQIIMVLILIKERRKMIKIVAITNKKGQVSLCKNCYEIHGRYDTKTKKTKCLFCGKEIK